ncbi:MAG: phosphoribosyl-AMP cyclohydrolase, partial [Nanoarchaeota archaeon]|nr:phosphoribosyl-AMP cyclohydrolase [Nanoarchaeota archaeon]
MIELKINDIKFDEKGLVPVIVQDWNTGKILMQAYANKEAVELTIKTGLAHFYSRSRKELWLKGETSGNYQKVRKILIDCDGDSLIYVAEPKGPACHTGNYSCFYRSLEGYKMVEDIIEEIKGYYENSKLIEKNWVRDESEKVYKYILNPITENVPPPSTRVMSFLADTIDSVTRDDFDKVLVPESFGLPIATLVAERKGKPMSIVRKRNLGDEPLSRVDYASGYEKGTYYIYGISEGESVLLIDDAISTGGTVEAIISELQKFKVDVVDVAVSMSKET